MSRIRRNFNLLEWAIYLAEQETLMRKRAAETARQTDQPVPEDEPSSSSDSPLTLLISRLHSPDKRIRWDVAKALGDVGDPAAAEALVQMLLDEDHSVRWAAIGSLNNMHRSAVRPLLVSLTQNFQSPRLREGAHHVLRTLHHRGSLNNLETEVLHALEGTAPGIQAAWAANNALIGHPAAPGS
jgi:HEAT repeat protein